MSENAGQFIVGNNIHNEKKANYTSTFFFFAGLNISTSCDKFQSFLMTLNYSPRKKSHKIDEVYISCENMIDH